MVSVVDLDFLALALSCRYFLIGVTGLWGGWGSMWAIFFNFKIFISWLLLAVGAAGLGFLEVFNQQKSVVCIRTNCSSILVKSFQDFPEFF